MNSEVVGLEQSLVAGAIALAAVGAIGATLILFPLLDRFVRPRYRLERGSAMLLLLSLSILVGLLTGVGAYYWLRDREEKRQESPGEIQVKQDDAQTE